MTPLGISHLAMLLPENSNKTRQHVHEGEVEASSHQVAASIVQPDVFDAPMPTLVAHKYIKWQIIS